MPTVNARLSRLEAEVACLREWCEEHSGNEDDAGDPRVYTPIVHVACGEFRWQCNNWSHMLQMLCQLVQLPEGPSPQAVLKAYARGLRRVPRDELADGDVEPIEKCEAWVGASIFAPSRRRESGLAMAAFIENTEKALESYPLTQEVVQYTLELLDSTQGVDVTYPSCGGSR